MSNYRSVSILLLLSKPFERIYFPTFETWKEVLDNGGSCGALLVDFSKVFDCS